jgi:hypothetical protein
MNSQAGFVERRKHSRQGVMAELEDITYSVLRKNAAIGESSREAAAAEPITE